MPKKREKARKCELPNCPRPATVQNEAKEWRCTAHRDYSVLDQLREYAVIPPYEVRG